MYVYLYLLLYLYLFIFIYTLLDSLLVPTFPLFGLYWNDFWAFEPSGFFELVGSAVLRLYKLLGFLTFGSVSERWKLDGRTDGWMMDVEKERLAFIGLDRL